MGRKCHEWIHWTFNLFLKKKWTEQMHASNNNKNEEWPISFMNEMNV